MELATTRWTGPELRAELRERLGSVLAIGDDTTDPIVAALLARGHVLIEGVPGTGKTLLARTLATCIGGTFNRIQFTNDLMPADVVGSSVWRPHSQSFEFVSGPLFANVVLCDEINRTGPRTLSCLLEAMESGRVSVEGTALELGAPFFVLATRNGIEFHGTHPIPEAALDRFLARVELGYPTADAELELYRGRDPEHALARLEPLLDLAELIAVQDAVRRVVVSEPVARYCYALVRATREHGAFVLGASPRSALSWLGAAKARAFLDGRDYVLPDDLQALVHPILGHRVFTRDGAAPAAALGDILDQTPVEL